MQRDRRAARAALLATMALAMPALPAAAADPAADAAAVMACMRANVPQTARVQAFEIQSFDRTGNARQLSGRLYSMREGGGAGRLSANLRVEKPVELAGAAYLVQETDDYLRDGMFIYLPSVRRVRRVTGTFADGALLGTNFSYYDFKQMANAFGDLVPRHEGGETLDGRAVHRLSFAPVDGTETRYSGARAWIDRASCVALKVEFLAGSQVVKTLASPASALRESAGHRYAEEVELREPGEGTRTVIRFGRVTSDQALPRRLFDPTAFHIGN